jgi:hypothetical protein
MRLVICPVVLEELVDRIVGLVLDVEVQEVGIPMFRGKIVELSSIVCVNVTDVGASRERRALLNRQNPGPAHPSTADDRGVLRGRDLVR